MKSSQKVRITLETTSRQKHPLAGLCGALPDKDAAEILKVIDEEFEKVDNFASQQ